jgi:hypothetical protein
MSKRRSNTQALICFCGMLICVICYFIAAFVCDNFKPIFFLIGMLIFMSLLPCLKNENSSELEIKEIEEFWEKKWRQKELKRRKN